MCLCCHPVRCCLSQMGHADWIWYCDVAVKDALLPGTQQTSNSLTDGKALCKLSNSFSWKVYCTCKDRRRWGVKTSFSRSLRWAYCSFPEQKQKGCCASGHLCKKRFLPATKPSLVGWLCSEWRTPIGRPDNPHRWFKCASLETLLSKATLNLRGKPRMEGYKGRRSETEVGGRASESINTKTIYGPSTIRPRLFKGRCKRVLAFLYETEKERKFLAISDSKILTLCNSMHVNCFLFFFVMDAFHTQKV